MASSASMRHTNSVRQPIAAKSEIDIFKMIDENNLLELLLAIKRNPEILHQFGGPEREQTPIQYAAFKERWEIVKAITSAVPTDKTNKARYGSALFMALNKNRLDVVTQFLAIGTPIEDWLSTKSENNMLHEAIRHNHPALVALLIQRGIRLDWQNKNKETPILYAARYGRWECVETIANTHKIESDLEADYYQVFKLAVENKQPNAVIALLEAGVLKSKTFLESNCLHDWIKAGGVSVEFFKLFLSYNVDLLEVRDSTGHTLLSLALSKNKNMYVECFLDYYPTTPDYFIRDINNRFLSIKARSASSIDQEIKNLQVLEMIMLKKELASLSDPTLTVSDQTGLLQRSLTILIQNPDRFISTEDQVKIRQLSGTDRVAQIIDQHMQRKSQIMDYAKRVSDWLHSVKAQIQTGEWKKGEFTLTRPSNMRQLSQTLEGLSHTNTLSEIVSIHQKFIKALNVIQSSDGRAPVIQKYYDGLKKEAAALTFSAEASRYYVFSGSAGQSGPAVDGPLYPVLPIVGSSTDMQPSAPLKP